MSKVLARSLGGADMQISSFSGGRLRGPCIQLTLANDYVQLTEQEAAELVRVVTKWLEEKQRLEQKGVGG